MVAGPRAPVASAKNPANSPPEWGASLGVRIDPGDDGRGLSLSFALVWGNAASGSERLWGDLAMPRRSLRRARSSRPGNGSTRSSATASAFSGEAREFRAGYGYRLGSGVDVTLDATRREAANDDAPEHAGDARTAVRW